MFEGRIKIRCFSSFTICQEWKQEALSKNDREWKVGSGEEANLSMKRSKSRVFDFLAWIMVWRCWRTRHLEATPSVEWRFCLIILRAHAILFQMKYLYIIEGHAMGFSYLRAAVIFKFWVVFVYSPRRFFWEDNKTFWMAFRMVCEVPSFKKSSLGLFSHK